MKLEWLERDGDHHLSVDDWPFGMVCTHQKYGVLIVWDGTKKNIKSSLEEGKKWLENVAISKQAANEAFKKSMDSLEKPQ